MEQRTGAANRETAETTVAVTIDLDGDGESTVDTGLPFLDHMLDAFATHGRFDLTVEADGDLETGAHHTVEDVGIVLGQALADAIGEGRGLERFADRRVPMDESQATVVVDVSGRPYFGFDGSFSGARVGEMATDMARHFFRSVADNAGLTLHVAVDGRNAHHEVEALFKAAGLAFDDATRLDDRGAVPSTKGEL